VSVLVAQELYAALNEPPDEAATTVTVIFAPNTPLPGEARDGTEVLLA
jgi:hypothetical protein